MLAYLVRRILVTIPLLFVALYLVHVGVSSTRDPLGDFYLCLPRCQDGFDAITAQYNLDQSVWLRPFGRLLYTMPPYVIGDEDLSTVIRAMTEVVAENAER